MEDIGKKSNWSGQKRVHPTEKLTAITNARVFDGERVIDERTVLIDGSHIRAVGGEVPAGASIIDAHGATLMPGLIDAHVHTDMDGLRYALRFGVTTELEMNGHWSRRERKQIDIMTMCPSVRPIERAMREPRMDPQSTVFPAQPCLP